MRRLWAFFVQLICAFTERTVGLLGKDVWELTPVIIHGLVVNEDHIPQLSHLTLRRFCHINIALEVARVTWHLSIILAKKFLWGLEKTGTDVGLTSFVENPNSCAAKANWAADAA